MINFDITAFCSDTYISEYGFWYVFHVFNVYAVFIPDVCKCVVINVYVLTRLDIPSTEASKLSMFFDEMN